MSLCGLPCPVIVITADPPPKQTGQHGEKNPATRARPLSVRLSLLNRHRQRRHPIRWCFGVVARGPLLVPLTTHFAAAPYMAAAHSFLQTWEKPCLVMFSDR